MAAAPRLREQRGLLRYWLARVLGTCGLQMLAVALGWQMYELTGSAWDLGLIGLVQFVPAFVLAPVAGQLADRLHRGRLLAACLLMQAGAAAVLLDAALQGGGTRATLLGAALVLGAARGFQLPAQQALLPQLVPATLLSRATAFAAGGGQLAIVAGPALGGLLLLHGAVAAYAACAALLLAGFGLAAGLRPQRAAVADEPVTLDSLLAGARFVWGHKVMLGALSLDLFAVLLAGATALLPVYARDVLQAGPAGLGLLRAAPAAGALAMSIVLARRPVHRRIGAKMIAAVAVYATAMLVFGLSTHLLLSLAALAVAGSADMVSVVVRHTLVQAETPDAMRGRVGAVNAMFMGASNQLGEFESGATASWLGPAGSIVLGSVLTLALAAAWLRLFPQLARRDRFQG